MRPPLVRCLSETSSPVAWPGLALRYLISRLCAASSVAELRGGQQHELMALLSTNSRTAVPQAICVPNSSGRAIRNSRNSGSSSTGAPPQCVLLTAQALCCSFSGRSVSAGQGGCSGRFIPKLSQRAQRSPTAKRTAPWSAGAVNSMEVQAVNCSSEAEPLVGQVSAPARAAGGVIASLLTAVGGLLGSAGSSGRGDIQEGSGGGGAGEGKVGAVKNLLRLGCAIVTPAVGAAASSAEHWWSPYVPGMDDIFASVVTMGAALAFLQIFNELAKRDVLDKVSLSIFSLSVSVSVSLPLLFPAPIPCRSWGCVEIRSIRFPRVR